jgi:hypothetical protein
MEKFGVFVFRESPWNSQENDLVHIGPTAWILKTQVDEDDGSSIVSLKWPTSSFEGNYLKMARDSRRAIFMETSARLVFSSNGMYLIDIYLNRELPC